MTRARFIPIAVILASVAGGPASAQPAATNRPAAISPTVEQEFRARIADLEQQLESLKRQLSTIAGTASEPVTPALSSAPTPAAPSLDEQIEALDQRFRIFAREDELRREAQAEQARVAPAVGASRDGFQLRSADGAFSLRLRGILQSDNRFFVNDSADTGADTFVLRRVRPTVEATFFKNFDLRLVPDFGNGQAVVQDAYMDLKFATAFRVRAGKQKQPFGLERLVSSSDLLFVERAMPTTVAGNRDIGVMAYGDVLTGRLSYFAGAFNGVIDGSSADFDDRDGKDVIVRIFAHPFRTSKDARWQGLGIGVAASHGSQRGTVALPSVAVYRTAGQQVYFRYLSDGTANGTTIADGTRQRISAQGYYYYRRFGLLGEQVFSSQDIRRGLTTAEAHVNSWQLAPSWVLTGEAASYRGVVPRRPFDPANGGWGAFELTGRYNQLSVDDELFPVFASRSTAADSARGGAVGLNWYMNRNVKLVFNYEQTRFVGGAAGGANRRPEHDILSRVQFSF